MAANTITLGARTEGFLSQWAGQRCTWVARGLLLIAFFLLPLSAAGTVTLGFTLTASQVVGGAAVAIGVMASVRGWLSLPRWLGMLAALLLGVYLVAALLGEQAAVPGQTARAGHRDLVYVADLIVGLGVVGIAIDARSPSFFKRAAVAIAAGAFLASLYAVYQWFAQHYGWPLANVNNAVNSDGYTVGNAPQGAGLFGWERVRGTFKEPLFLGSFLVLALPFFLVLAHQAKGRVRLLIVLTALPVLLATVLTVSTLAWGAGVAAAAGCVLVFLIQRGRGMLAGVLGMVCVLIAVTAPVLFASPETLSALTGRTGGALQTTSDNRTAAWNDALAQWREKPVLGHGPGQSAVQLAYRPDVSAARVEPLVYGSAQGLWAASLVDAGLVGLCAWIALLGGFFVYAARSALASASPVLLGATAASLVAVLIGQLSADRLDLRVWLVLGLMLAAACRSVGGHPAERHEQAG